MENHKQWWTPVWIGLVRDGNAKHYRRMKAALWLFLYLLAYADRRSGFLKRKIKTISTGMGISRDTVIRWLNLLRKGGYITTENTSRCLHIQVNKWKNLSEVGNIQPQKLEESDLCGWKNPTGGKPHEYLKSLLLRRKSAGFPEPNDITIKKDILKNDIDGNLSNNTNSPAFKERGQGKGKDQVAMDIASALNDYQNLALYRSYSKKYPASLLWKVLGEVERVPPEKIKKSRGALFNYLVQHYVKKSS